MNVETRKILTYRFVSSILLLLNLGFVGYISSYIFQTKSQNQIVSVIACIFTAVFIIFEIILILRGWKKELILYKIAFNPNDKVNNVPLIAVGIGSLFGVGLLIMGILLNVLKHVEPNITTSLVIIAIAIYLLINCMIYFLYVIMFKKREVRLEDFIK